MPAVKFWESQTLSPAAAAELDAMLFDAAAQRQMALVLPTASDVAKYAPAAAPEDDFLTENEKGLPCVRRPVGLRMSPPDNPPDPDGEHEPDGGES